MPPAGIAGVWRAWLKRSSHLPRAAKGTVASALFFVFVDVFVGGRQDRGSEGENRGVSVVWRCLSALRHVALTLDHELVGVRLQVEARARQV